MNKHQRMRDPRISKAFLQQSALARMVRPAPNVHACMHGRNPVLLRMSRGGPGDHDLINKTETQMLDDTCKGKYDKMKTKS